MKIDAETLKKQVILHLPYVLFLLVFINLSRNIIVTSVVGVIYGFASCLFIGSESGFVIPGSFAYRVSMFFSDKSTYYDSPVLATIGGCISFVLCFIVMFLVGLIVFSHKKKIEN